jgi:hypothetical protein
MATKKHIKQLDALLTVLLEYYGHSLPEYVLFYQSGIASDERLREQLLARLLKDKLISQEPSLAGRHISLLEKGVTFITQGGYAALYPPETNRQQHRLPSRIWLLLTLGGTWGTAWFAHLNDQHRNALQASQKMIVKLQQQNDSLRRELGKSILMLR